MNERSAPRGRSSGFGKGEGSVGRKPGARGGRPFAGGATGRSGGFRSGPRPAPRAPEAPSPRRLALDVLERVEQSRSAKAADIAQELGVDSKLDGRGRRFFQELVYGVLRRRITLDCVISAYSKEPIQRLEPDCLQALRLGIYQLLFLDGVPPFAAVSESLNLLQYRHPGVRALANAVLRGASRELNRIDASEDRGGASPRKRLPVSETKVAFFSRNIFIDPEENRALYLAQVHSHPPFLVERWLQRYDRAVVEGILAAGNRKPLTSVRVNRLKTDREGLMRRFVAEGIPARPGILSEALLLDATPSEAVASGAFTEGLFYLQDEAAMKVAPALEPKPDERLLDFCSAPGGKATHLAELTADRARIVAVDRDPVRLARIAENCTRLGIKSVTPVQFNPAEMREDGPLPPEELRGTFDAAILDVPCSNTGVLARRPEVRWRLSLEAILTLSERGRQLLGQAAKFVRHGGRIIYSTCSLETEENDGAIERALVANPGLELLRQEETLPTPHGPDGGYFAILKRDVNRGR